MPAGAPLGYECTNLLLWYKSVKNVDLKSKSTGISSRNDSNCHENWKWKLKISHRSWQITSFRELTPVDFGFKPAFLTDLYQSNKFVHSYPKGAPAGICTQKITNFAYIFQSKKELGWKYWFLSRSVATFARTKTCLDTHFNLIRPKETPNELRIRQCKQFCLRMKF